jgi:uncharacterized repeat protein (TIGR03806 family)
VTEGVFRKVAALLLGASLWAGCGGTPQSSCTPVRGGATGFPTLDAWCQVSLVDGDVVPHAGVTPYNLNTPLFSDYAVKRRTVWMPSGASATYDANNVFTFSDGTVLTKSFGFADDLRKANPSIHWVETRVVWLSGGLWQAVSYTWDEAQKTASIAPGGAVTPVSWVDEGGQTVSTNYLVPEAPQCLECHQDYGDLKPIGPKARNLNRDLAYPDGGTQNQLTHWTEAGLLSGAPADVSTAPKLAVWNDASTGSLEERARAYLESNCAHCHSEGGQAHTSGLHLSTLETNPVAYGICKKPIAAGAGAGGRLYDIVPGNPDASIIPFRLNATTPPAAMPQLGRTVVDTQGLQLVHDWIASLSGGCP